MKYLYSARLGQVVPETNAPEGEPVIPAFPVADNINTFIACPSFRPSFYAVVKDQPLDVDTLGDAIKKEYRGLPPELIDEYILAVIRACNGLPVNTAVQVFITYDITKLKMVDSDDLVTLWTKQPLPRDA